MRSTDATTELVLQDLNDLFYFSEVVSHGGFAAAGRALRLPKSKLSRRVAQLEGRLGVRLIERSSRSFRVTEIGQSFFERCRSALAEVERAEALVDAARAEPRGTVRFSCPTGLMELVAQVMPDFLERHPLVNVRVLATDRPVDLIAEHIDVALRVRVSLDTDAALTMRTLARSRRILIASPKLANTLGDAEDIAALASLPTVSSSEQPGSVTWTLEGPRGLTHSLTHEPRIACGDFIALREAALAGLGVALLPDHACTEALRSGRLVRLFPQWHSREGIVHLVFTTRTGLPAHVRAWIDHLAERFRDKRLFSGTAAEG
ncbi:LysR family transcriptional regulator [Rhizobium sp. BK251]|uniref:LysR family transcriptional regulator n=1 Tax=Rhizobium sp. BK251 TaxID=2512125 RepID=UPI00140546EC|nr:LysR family transcriptional regulator [Rhizobium sp. BK251]